jgi:hypothetical protein
MNHPHPGSALSRQYLAAAERYLHEARHARSVARATLREILSMNGDTAWGRAHGLDGRSALAAFEAHPLTTYADFAAHIERMAAGEAGVLTTDTLAHFASSAGTTGHQKLLPITTRQAHMLRRHLFVPLGMAIRCGALGPMRGRWLQLLIEAGLGRTPGGTPVTGITGESFRQLEPLLRGLCTSPWPVIRLDHQASARYLHLLFALEEPCLWTIVSVYPAMLLDMMRDLEARAGDLLRDLADGTIHHGLELAAAVRAELSAMRRPAPERARALGALLAQGPLTVREIWPEVGCLLTVGSGSFRFYVDQLRPYLGGVPVYSASYLATEAAIGIGPGPERTGYILSTGAAYHELLPIASDGTVDPTPVAACDADIGGLYEPVVTTFAGLVRYRLGDVVRVVDRYGQAPVLEFIERRGPLLRIWREKLTEELVARALEGACREVAAPLTDYLVTVDPGVSPSRYLLVIEARDIGREGLEPARSRALLAAFERRLRASQPTYDEVRSRGLLGPPGLLEVACGTFERLLADRRGPGLSPSQQKVPHLVPDPAVITRHFSDAHRLELSSAPGAMPDRDRPDREQEK